ncbi:hypothetical protein ACP4OV_019439 [Aristida adscensionis]
MAAPVPRQLKVRVPENEEVARALHEKRLSMREQPGGLKENLDLTFAKAYRSVCAAKEPIRTLKDFSEIKGVGPWLIRCMKGFFPQSNQELVPTKGKKTRRPKSNLAKKNTAASGRGYPSKFGLPDCSASISLISSQETFDLPPSSGSTEFNMLEESKVFMDSSTLPMPPCQSSEGFLEAYEVVLILDDRENFGSSRKIASREVAENIRSRFNVPVEVRRLPVGDGIWIARNRKLLMEYVLDFIVERKNVDDLVSSITDNRYKDQKLRLQKCGLRKLIYLVEGDPNALKMPTEEASIKATERVKTACFTTEILEGFDVQRTSGYADTKRAYGDLTLSIIEYYSTHFSAFADNSRVCQTYDEFEAKCRGVKKKTVGQIFALQLMQVPQVTEEAALAVIEFYPTLLSLARAYSMLEGDILAQEDMLKNKIKVVNAGASRNIFKLVWGDGDPIS